MKILIKYLSISLLVFCNQVFAGWELQGDDSDIHFVSIKKGSVGEVHTFNRLSGAVTEKGDFEIVIDLKSVNTQIDIRNERMKDHLFEVKKFPLAKISGSLDSKVIKGLKPGQSVSTTVTFVLDLHGKQISQSTTILLFALANGGVRVNSTEPLLVDASSFDLLAGIEQLKQLASLPSIASTVPVTFNLHFAPTDSKK